MGSSSCWSGGVLFLREYLSASYHVSPVFILLFTGAPRPSRESPYRKRACVGAPRNTKMAASDFHDIFPHGDDTTPYRKLTSDYVASTSLDGERIVKIDPKALTLLAQQGFVDCQHLLRPGHLQQLRTILDDDEASPNDKFVAFDLLKNANIAAGKILPMCQDTGTAIVMGKKGQRVWTGGGDAAALAAGIRRTYTETNLRYSQVAPLSMFEEVNTGDNLPAQIEIYADEGDAYKFLFIAKGGGSANKT